MAGYTPLKITGMSTGLVQSRENFLLPDDAYPILENAYVWRERIKRKKGYQLLGRLQRVKNGTPGSTDGAGNFLGNIIILLALEPTASITPGTWGAVLPGQVWSEPNPPDGSLLLNGVPAPPGSFINWATGVVGMVTGLPLTPVAMSFNYYPGLPVMGIRTRDLTDSENDETVFFDQKYAYVFDNLNDVFKEFIPGTTWNAQNAAVTATDFFWSTNYWVSDGVIFTTTNKKLFWVTNNTGAYKANADPIRVTDGTTWLNFSPPLYGQIDAGPNYLLQCLSMLPFRGRLLAFNTWEGDSYANGVNYSNRIRWSTIGNPFVAFAAGPPATGSWRDDIRGQGGFLDIPTSEDIIAVGFVRDNLVIYCEHSTWQLRYTGRSIAPFQIEKVNSELGAQSPFSAVQFDTSLVGIGDKGVVECDSYKSERIDIKIPDLVFGFEGQNSAKFRVHGVRDFINRLAFWTYPQDTDNSVFPTRRLVYNYENDSWAIFTDSLTTIGTYQSVTNRNWVNTHIPWVQCNFRWVDNLDSVPSIVGGNQQGFVEYLDELTSNDVSLYISNITGQATTTTTGNPTIVSSPNHNLVDGNVIQIRGIPVGSPYSTLNDGIFGVIILTLDSFQLMKYDPATGQFSTPQLDVPPAGTYIGGGLIAIRENFSVTSKKFNFLDEGQSIQLGHIDILLEATYSENPGAISLNIYLDYNDSQASNTIPMNDINDGSFTQNPDTFFNSTIPTTPSTLNGVGGDKFWQRVFCATRANFLTLQYTFSNAQLAGIEQELDVQIDAQILWIRKAGRITQI